MDIRTYFKGDAVEPTPPKSPPSKTFELPDYLFISAAAPGVKRSRSTVAENVEDSSTPDGFEYGLHRELAPLEVTTIRTEPKPPAQTTLSTKKRKNKRNSDDVPFFSDDLEEQARMFEAHKEKLKNMEMEQHKKTKTGNKRKSHKSTDTNNNEHLKKSPEKPEKSKLPPVPTSASRPPAPTTSHSVTTTVTKTSTTKITQISTPQSIKSQNPPTPPPTVTPALKPPPSVSHSISRPPNPPQRTNSHPSNLVTPSSSTSSSTSSASSSHPQQNTMSDKELEAKVQHKMEAVQQWQNKCSELRQQLADATANLTKALDELDELNSLYEKSNG